MGLGAMKRGPRWRFGSDAWFGTGGDNGDDDVIGGGGGGHGAGACGRLWEEGGVACDSRVSRLEDSGRQMHR